MPPAATPPIVRHPQVVAQSRDLIEGAANVGQGGSEARNQLLAGARRSDAACGSRKQTDADPLFKAANRMAECRGRHAEASGPLPILRPTRLEGAALSSMQPPVD